jgi:DNA (cytosine-5)-methyltransferase 1
MAIREVDWTDGYEQRPSGLYVPEGTEIERSYPTCVDLFCGAGGFSLGVMQAGFEVVAGVDNDEWSSITYMSNLGSYPIEIHYIDGEKDKERLNRVLERETKKKNELSTFLMSGSNWSSRNQDVPPVKHYFFGDIRKLKGSEILDAVGLKKGELDLVVGGPPCQGFSTSGQQDIMDPRNSLVFEYARIVLELWPKAFCMENVPGILSMYTPEGVPVVDAFCRILEDGGFGSFEALKKTLLTTAGAGAALRSKKNGKKKAAERPEAEADSVQEQLTF